MLTESFCALGTLNGAVFLQFDTDERVILMDIAGFTEIEDAIQKIKCSSSDNEPAFFYTKRMKPQVEQYYNIELKTTNEKHRGIWFIQMNDWMEAEAKPTNIMLMTLDLSH